MCLQSDCKTINNIKKQTETQSPEDEKSHKIWMSNIIPLNLEENPASGRGRYSSVSVLEPAMRIERTGDIVSADNRPSGSSEESYRIVVSFIFEVAISGFDQGFQKYNRFFDSVSLRYLFRHGEEVDLRPQSDSALHGIKVTNTRDKTKSIDAGVAAGMTTAVVPTLSVQAQRDFKLSYQRSMNSWRMGLSFESYPPIERPNPPWSSLLAARLVSHEKVPGQDREQSSFQVLSPHRTGCHCHDRPRQSHSHGCPMQHRRHHPEDKGSSAYRRRRPCLGYDRAAHWFWQTEASLRLWTPEIYSSFRCPVTVMREVPVSVVDGLCRIENVRPLLHFDFAVDTRLRALGLGLHFFQKATKPAELRAQTDMGQPLPSDHIRFCVSCCAENISWPRHPTRNLQAEAEEEILGLGRTPQRLPTNEEFNASLRGLQKKKRSTRASPDAAPWSNRIPAASMPDVEVSPGRAQRHFVPGQGLFLKRRATTQDTNRSNTARRRRGEDWQKPVLRRRSSLDYLVHDRQSRGREASNIKRGVRFQSLGREW